MTTPGSAAPKTAAPTARDRSAPPSDRGVAGQRVAATHDAPASTVDPVAAGGARARVLYCEVCEDGTAGGSHQVLFDLVRLLDRRRFDPVVVFYESNRFVEPLRALGVTVHVWEEERTIEHAAMATGSFSRKVFGALGAIRRRRQLLVDEEIDLVHLNNSPTMGFDDWLPAAKSLGIPCVTHVMGAPYALPTRAHHRLLIRRFDRLICISQHVHKEMRRAGHPERQLEHVQVGIDVDAFVARATRDPAELRAELGVAPDRMLVALVGNLQPWKGHDVVVSALTRIEPSLRSRMCVLFIGAIREQDRSHVDVLRGRIEAAGLSDTVRFLGSRTDVPDLLRAADVQLHASTFPEPFGLVLVEGLALGRPVVAASIGGPCEVISPDTGLLFDPGDPGELAEALRAMLVDPDRRARLGAAGPARARLFDSRHGVGRTEAIYSELLASRANRRADGGTDPVRT